MPLQTILKSFFQESRKTGRNAQGSQKTSTANTF